MSVFSYYNYSTTNEKDALTFLRDKLVLKNWVIDYDDISNSGVMIAHPNNTENYYKFEATNNFVFVYFGEFNGTNDLSTVYQNEGYAFNHNFEFKGLHIFVNDKFVILFREGYDVYQNVPRYTHILELFVGAGQIQTDDTLQSGLYMSMMHPYMYQYNFWSIDRFAFRYKNNLAKIQDNIDPLCALPNMYYQIFQGDDFIRDYSELANGQRYYNHGYFLYFEYFPMMFGKFTLINVPVIAYYVENSIEYRFPVGNLPFYLTYYYGEQDFARVIDIDTRKFMIMPACGNKEGAESGGQKTGVYYGIAIEVDNV